MDSARDGCQVGLASLGRVVVLSFQTLGAHTGAAVAASTVRKTKDGWHSSKDSPAQHR